MSRWFLPREATDTRHPFFRLIQLRARDRVGVILAAVLMTALLGVFATSISHDADAGRSALTERFQTRASLTASFVTGYVADLATRQQAQAERLLAGPDVSQAEFEQVVQGFDFTTAGLFDAEGRLLVISPEGPDLLGEPFADRYAYVEIALAERVGVSGVVATATTSSPVVAVAVSFPTPSGLRVFSGGVRPGTGSLRTYLDTVIPLAGRTYLIDDKGNVIVTGQSGDPSALPPRLTPGGLLRLDQSVGTFTSNGDTFVYVRESIAGTPWHVILTTPQALLYEPIVGTSHVSWSLFGAFAFAGLVGLVLYYRLARAHSVAAATALLDDLTRLPNRRAAEEHLRRTASAAFRHAQPYGILMIDVDNFKSINDTYGHETGDRVLSLVANTLRDVSRIEDLVCRWGGEEFLVAISTASEGTIAAAAERFRCAVANAAVRIGPKVHLSATISVGGAVSTDSEPREALNAADVALYAAKLGGRNRVVIDREPGVDADTARPLAEVGL